MRIKNIFVHQLKIPFKPLGSLWIGRRKPPCLDSTVVVLTTESGQTGVGETCPIGSVYLPAFALGVRAAIEEMAPALIGEDATNIARIAQVMDGSLFGHDYAKAAIDIACWDLLGKSTGLSISAIMGGRHQITIPAYASIPLDSPKEMVACTRERRTEGYQYFQVKVGDDPIEDVARARAVLGEARKGEVFMVDANRGWSKPDALRAVAALNQGPKFADCYIEQPCATYDECLVVRSKCPQPMILDEVIDTIKDLAKAIKDKALDGLVIKITHAGGLSKARLLRDVCLHHGIKMRIEDTAGTEITRAAQAQLAAATPPHMLLGSYSFLHSLPPSAQGTPELLDGRLHLNNEPGLGITPDMSVLGKPVAYYE